MSSPRREIVFRILQSLDKEKFKETVHKLEQESGVYFNIRYFEEMVINGDWDEVEKYLSGFMKVDDNKYSRKIFFEIRKQKYLEALDRNDQAKAVDILKKDLKVFSAFDDNVFKEMTQLLTLEDFRKKKELSEYGDSKSARRKMFDELEWLIQRNPLLNDKLNFPNWDSGQGTLINQSLNWQHPFHDTETPLVDPSCRQLQPIGAQALSSIANPLMGAVPKAGVFSPLGAHGPFQPVQATLPTYLAGWMDNSSFIRHPSASAMPIGFTEFNSGAATLEPPGIPPTNNSAVVYQTADSEHVLKRLRPSGILDEIWNVTEINEPSQCRSLRLPDNLTAMRVSRLMYTNSGLAILALASNAKHKLWKWPRNDENLTGKVTASVVPQLWKPSKGILMTNYNSNTNPEDAVPCLALSKNDSYVMSASGGKISLYDLMTFKTIESFVAPPPTATFIAFYPMDNNIIAVGMDDSSIQIFHFPLDEVISILNGLAFSNVLNVLVSSGADSRLARYYTETPLVDPSCRQLQPIGAQALSSIANPLMGAVPKAGVFSPLGAHGPFQPVQATLPTYLAGWMDNSSFIRHPSASAMPIGFTEFNSGAATLERPGIPPTNNSAVVYQTADSEHVLKRLRPSGILDEIWNVTEINEPSQCPSLRLPDNLTAMRVSRLMYTNSGLAILALASNAKHKLWKWPRNDENLTGKVTASVVPQLWKPSKGILMTNYNSNTNPEDAVPCLALSKNDSYVMSASGGKISLYDLMTFKIIESFVAPPPTATFIAFYPMDNNIIAVGMDDSSIQIFHFPLDEVISILNGHQERITGLAFSNVLNVLVSSGADSRICVWSTDEWKKQMSKCLQIPVGRATVPLTDTCVQFHQDQTRLLAVHVTQIAIYKAPKLELLNQWIPPKASSPLITHATYSCDSQSIYVGFDDGSVGILTASASLQLRCLINCTCYLPANPSSRVHPLVIAAHPSEPNQFALGLSDGGVCVLEPSESEGKWGTSPHENGAGPCNTSEAEASLDQPQQ